MARSRIAAAGAAVASVTAAAMVAVGVLGALPPVSGGAVVAAQAATVEYPVEADYCYVAGMLPHHAQALELSELVLAAGGVSDRVRALADFIVADQTAEITQMEAWATAWENTVAAIATSHDAHDTAGAVPEGTVSHCGHDAHTQMAGMATPDQLAALDAAEGAEAQGLFLELMIVHHEGALVMAETAILEGSNAFIRSSAKHVLVEQKREVDAMTVLLAPH